MKSILLVFVVCLLSTSSLFSYDRIFKFGGTDSDYYVRYLLDVENGRVSPLVVEKAQGVKSISVAIAYHPGEDMFYILSHGNVLKKARKGLFLVDGDVLEVIEEDFELSVAQARVALSDTKELRTIVSKLLGLCE
ncbi:MAG: hypothetical protein DRI24_22460 [Deltaproteobacteria bacterium]|nr:MAG: hypothetical protein DRI24_22460 [Deltaproteobacteria bacterium]